MKTDNDYNINEENDTGDEHVKLVLSRLVQNPDKTLEEIVIDTVPYGFRRTLLEAFNGFVENELYKTKQR